MSHLSPLSGEERKSNFGVARSVDDPFSDIGLARQRPTCFDGWTVITGLGAIPDWRTRQRKLA